MSINEAKTVRFDHFPAKFADFEQGKPIISIIMDCFYGLDLVRQSVQSVLDQDYPNVELILVDNGAQKDVSDYLHQVYASEKNVPLIKFKENQFAWNDTEKSAAVCWNAALIHSGGDFIAHLAYDDLLSKNYASKMVQLFMDNPDCVTAAPMPAGIDGQGKITGSSNAGNSRGRYTDGVQIALDVLRGNPKRLLSAPGEIFAIKRSLLLEHGGFDRMIDLSQTLKYAILGVSGFDPEAFVYWRHHDGQLNKLAKKRGAIFYSSNEAAWHESGIVDIWQKRFDAAEVQLLLAFKKRRAAAGPIGVIRENVSRKNFRGVFFAIVNVARECPHLLLAALYATAAQTFSILLGKFLRMAFSRKDASQG